jgi:hypothetical protein
MTEKSASDVLRELLDERGVEYKTDDRNGLRETIWCGTAAFQLSPTAVMTMIVTPEQAIAATLGDEECKWMLKEKWPDRMGDDHMYGYETSCGARHTWWPDSLPNFCPTCGSKTKAVKR